MRHRAKFCANRSRRCGDMAVFFKMAAVRHLGFVIRLFGPPTKCIQRVLSEYSPCRLAVMPTVFTCSNQHAAELANFRHSSTVKSLNGQRHSQAKIR